MFRKMTLLAAPRLIGGAAANVSFVAIVDPSIGRTLTPKQLRAAPIINCLRLTSSPLLNIELSDIFLCG
jgi:hypothetical protein